MGRLGRAIKLAARGPVKVRSQVRQVDRGLVAIQNALHSIANNKTYVKVGYLGKAGKPRPNAKGDTSTPLTNVQLGVIHEFGQGRVPARPHIRPAFAQNKAEYLALLQKLVVASVYSGKMTYPRALGIMGAKIAADMKKFVTAGTQIPPPNQGYPDSGYFLEKVKRGQWKLDQKRARAAKAKAKGKPAKDVYEGPIPPPRTLVDTGRMIGSITWAVVYRSTESVRAGKGRGSRTGVKRVAEGGKIR